MPKPTMITAELRQWRRRREYIWGRIYGDTRSNPYLDGDLVSIRILYLAEHTDYWLLTSGIPGGGKENRDHYKLEKIHEYTRSLGME